VDLGPSLFFEECPYNALVESFSHFDVIRTLPYRSQFRNPEKTKLDYSFRVADHPQVGQTTQYKGVRT
jgi:hypothetical protein